MKADDLWIGDWLLIRPINKKGVFEGFENDQLKIKCDDETVFAGIEEVELTEAPKKKDPKKKDTPNAKIIISDETENIVVSKATFQNTIDLHIEKLNPSFQFEFNELKYQINVCDQFIKKAINNRQAFITIIHGKGKGILKNEINTLLEKYKDYISVVNSANNGGAVEVWLKN